MASNQNPPEKMNSFTKGMVKDSNDTYIGEGVWSHARNLVNNSHDGQLGVIGNEPSNLLCVTLPYTLIGTISISDGKWILFTTDNINSEIGIFDEVKCNTSEAAYVMLVNDKCLNFKTTNLITGVSRKTFDCSEKIYWADGLNPDRVLDITNIPYKKTCTTSSTGCTTCINNIPLQLDCDNIRIAPLLDVPCITLNKADGSGTLLNGTYQVAIAYMVNEIKVTDYLMVSNPVSIWSHSGVGGALNLVLANTDKDFTEIEVVVISNINGQTVAKQLGVYSTRQSNIYIDNIDPTLVTIPIANIPLITPAIEKSNAMYPINNYLTRVGVYTKPDFNYQPQANKIVTKWQSIEYPANYYSKGGKNVGYMRDEIYSFFIRWIYNTGDRSASYHIPGRPKTTADAAWETENTAYATGTPSSSFIDDGGVILKEGYMSYWESQEKYPDDNPAVWNQTLTGTTPYDLCGQQIRHHKFPDNNTCQETEHFINDKIRVLGIAFSNVTAPKYNNGSIITEIVGYEILRGSREGHKSVVAKGMVNNMKHYNVLDANNNSAIGYGIMQNYPYNDITTTDPFYETNVGMTPLKDYVSFHSPDTNFQRPYFGNPYLRVYGDLIGKIDDGGFETPYLHPEFKILGDLAGKFAVIVAALLVVLQGLQAAGLGGTTTMGSTNDLPMSVDTIGPVRPPDLGTAGAAVTGPLWALTVLAQAAEFVFSVPFYAKINKQKILDIITAFVPVRQYAKQFNSHGFYNTYRKNKETLLINDYGYIKDTVQFFSGFKVNNLYRNGYVALKLNSNISNPSVVDTSLQLLNTPIDSLNVKSLTISSRYAALKINIKTLYGQIDSIRQIPITSCVYKITDSPTLFGGDTYINKYTEKNQHLFFNDWLINQPKDYAYNYKNYQNIIGTAYWVDNRKMYDGFFTPLNKVFSLWNPDQNGWHVDPGHFFLFCNGVREFYVESEVNVGYRDWDDEITKRFYDSKEFSDLSLMFRSDYIKAPGYYKYDYSLSVSRLYNQFVTWGAALPRSFNPTKAETCYSYYPRRVIYSLPQSEELKKDNWQSFLVNNYKDFHSKVTAIKAINKTGALMLLEKESPLFYNGVDTLQTSAGIKVTIGDGGLFTQANQSVTNADDIYQYGSCQNKFSIINIPQGVYYVSQDQGKIFHYGQGLNEISRNGMKWWFSRYLPSQLKKYFPNYDLYDNPVEGTGITVVYDNTNEVIYFSKKDYIPKENTKLQYTPGVGFTVTLGTSGTGTGAGLGSPTISVSNFPSSYIECPPGYTLIGGTCIKTTQAPVEPTVTTISASPVTGSAFASLGTVVYNQGYTSAGIGTYSTISSGNNFWINHTEDSATGPINNTINSIQYSTMIRYTTSETNPVTYDVYVNVLENTKTFYVALANNSTSATISLKIDNTTLFTMSDSTLSTLHGVAALSGILYNKLHIYPITLSKGKHTITMSGAKAGFTGIVIDDTLENIQMAKAYSDLNILFTTSTKTSFKVITYSSESKVLFPGLYNVSKLRITTAGSIGNTIEFKMNEYDPIDYTPRTISLGTYTLTSTNIDVIGDGIISAINNKTIDHNYKAYYDVTNNDIYIIAPENQLDLLLGKSPTSTLSPSTSSLNITLGSFANQTFAYVPSNDNQSFTLRTEPVSNIVFPINRKIDVCDPAYFEDASWTISYDLKNNQWLGFHDWHPELMIPTKTHFLTSYRACKIKTSGLWKHNNRWDDFCNFYGTYYPFEVEYVIPTGDTVTTMKNVEYVLEAYKYGTNGQDKFHLLDYNFDEAIVYNSEQTSGQLNLKLKDKSNPFSYLQYPNILGSGSTDILFSKEEQKYRFNQFNDITKDRGEFSGAQNILTTTSPNGYTWTVNPIAVDYYKPALQRKKFRHNVGKVLLRKKAIDKKTTPTADGGIKILFKMITTKLQQSQK
jgi:hypothetical protein